MAYDDDEPSEDPKERTFHVDDRAKDVLDEFRMHAEIAAIFEGTRKFDAQIRPTLDASIARDIQQRMAKLDRSKFEGTAVITVESMPSAHEVLTVCDREGLPTNDYHVYRRPGEVMIVRWLAGAEDVDLFYQRLQAHFEAGIAGFVEDTRQAMAWKDEGESDKLIQAVEGNKVAMDEWYARPATKKGACVLNTRAADEINILFLSDQVMAVPVEDLVGAASAPPEGASEPELAWFYKTFSLRGIVEQTERMCFFAFLQRSDEGF